MNKLNFYIENDKVFDTKGNEILPDENGIVHVDIDGKIRRFIRPKLIKWLEDNPDIRQAKVPKQKPIPSQWEAKIQAKLNKSNPVSPEIPKKPRKPRTPRPKDEIVPTDPEERAIWQKERHRRQTRESMRRLRGSKPREPKQPKVKKPMGRPRILPRDENGNLIKPPSRPKGKPRIHPRDENGKRIRIRTGGEHGIKRRKIELINTGQIFNSMYQAEKELGMPRAAIWKLIRGDYKSSKGLQFKYVEQ